MGAVSDTSAVEVVDRHMRFPIIAVGIRLPDLASLTDPIVAARTGMWQISQALQTSEDGMFRSRTRLEVREEANKILVQDVIDVIARLEKVDPSLRLHEPVLQGKSKSDITRSRGTGVGAETQMLRKIAGRITALETRAPAALAALALQLVEAADVTDTLLAELNQSLTGLQNARAALRQAKRTALDALSALRGELTARFPRNRAYVSSFFLPNDYDRAVPATGQGEAQPA